MSPKSIALLLLASGCYPYEDYLVDGAEATCGTYARCGILPVIGYDDVDDCVSDQNTWDEADPPTCETYDPGAAKDCVDEIVAASCDDGLYTPPAVCAEVCPAS